MASVKIVCNGDTADFTQLKQQNQKGAIILVAHGHNLNVLLSNSTVLIFAVLVV